MVEQLLEHGNQLAYEQLLIQMNPVVCISKGDQSYTSIALVCLVL